MSSSVRKQPVSKLWLSVTPLIDGLVNHGFLSIGDTLTIHFNGYSTKTNYPNAWYIKPFAFWVEAKDIKINRLDIIHIFPRFTYLNLTKTQTVNPEIINLVVKTVLIKGRIHACHKFERKVRPRSDLGQK